MLAGFWFLRQFLKLSLTLCLQISTLPLWCQQNPLNLRELRKEFRRLDWRGECTYCTEELDATCAYFDLEGSDAESEESLDLDGTTLLCRRCVSLHEKQCAAWGLRSRSASAGDTEESDPGDDGFPGESFEEDSEDPEDHDLLYGRWALLYNEWDQFDK